MGGGRGLVLGDAIACGFGLMGAAGTTWAGAGALTGRGICRTGTLTTGYFGLLDLTLSTTCWPGVTSNPCGNASMAVKDTPGRGARPLFPHLAQWWNFFVCTFP